MVRPLSPNSARLADAFDSVVPFSSDEVWVTAPCGKETYTVVRLAEQSRHIVRLTHGKVSVVRFARHPLEENDAIRGQGRGDGDRRLHSVRVHVSGESRARRRIVCWCDGNAPDVLPVTQSRSDTTGVPC